MNWKGCGRKCSRSHLRYNSSICLEGLRKTIKRTKKSRSPGRDLPPGPLEYKARVLTPLGRGFDVFIFSYPISRRSILILSSHLCLSVQRSCLFPSFRTNNSYVFLILPHACYMPHQSHSLWFNHPDTWRASLSFLLQNHHEAGTPRVRKEIITGKSEVLSAVGSGGEL
jgi:hypothetical protein